MSPHDRPRHPTGYADWEWILTDDGSRTLFQRELNETFHSGCGAVAETLIVYLWHSGLLARLREGAPSVVVEFGLGTATGFLLTAALAEHYQTPLVYFALEQALLPVPLYHDLHLAQAVDLCIQSQCARPAFGIDPEFSQAEFRLLTPMVDRWCQALLTESNPSWPTAIPTQPESRSRTEPNVKLLTRQLSEFVRVQLILGDAAGIDHGALAAIPTAGCDAIYFDPFSPDSNPELWTTKIFQQAHSFLKPTGRLVSYCVKSSVRRELAACGFEVHKVAGPLGGKREVLQALKKR
jgi:tRNA U34 5-methylaminomethyl-2-thiouridine-forming methyltransferase MnmC